MPLPYTYLAPVYDRLMEHVSYESWYYYIRQINGKFPFPSRDMLEIGSGSGKLTKLFQGSEWRITCSDLCLQMAMLARKRLSRKSVPLVVQDARRLAVRGPYGFVFFLYDGINYLRSASDLAACLREVRKVLLPGGYFLFDVTTEKNSLDHFTDYTYFDDAGTHCYARHSYYDPGTRTQYNRFNLFERMPDESYRRFVEVHCQKVYSLEDISKAARKAGYKQVGMYDGYGFRKANRNSYRVHFLLKKGA